MNSEINWWIMSLQAKVFSYLDAIRDDVKNPKRIDKVKELLQAKKFEETQVYSVKVATLVNILFHYMPEIKTADPYHQKLYSLRQYCENLPKAKKTPKGPRSR